MLRAHSLHVSVSTGHATVLSGSENEGTGDPLEFLDEYIQGDTRYQSPSVPTENH